MASTRKDQNLAVAELHSVCTTLMKKFATITDGAKTSMNEELRDLIKLLVHGAKSEILHENFKLNIFHFLKHVLTFSDVRSVQSGASFKNKIMLALALRLMYFNISDPTLSINEFKGKHVIDLLWCALQRSLSFNTKTVNTAIYQGLTSYDIHSGVPKISILYLPLTLANQEVWTIEQAGEISNKFGQWLLLQSNPATPSPARKSLFQNKGIPMTPSTTEMDGSTSRDIFTVLNLNQSYHTESLVNIYCFSILKAWIYYVQGKDDMAECLTNQLNKLAVTKEMISQSGSPISIGGSRFYNEFSSGSDSAESQSLSSSLSSFHSFMHDDDQLEVRKGIDSSRTQTPFDARFTDSRPQTPFRKQTQALDTISVTSDVLSNASNLKTVAIRYCLRVINQSERLPKRDVDRGVVTASVVECIEILNVLCQEDTTIAQKTYLEIKRLYKRIEEKPFAARRVFVALLNFFIHHHEDMMLQVDDILEIYFREIPSKYYESQTAAFELFDLCLQNRDFFKMKTNILFKYFPNVLKLAAWWPTTFLEEICELIDIFVNSPNICEVLHAILDLPCVSALLHLKSQRILEDNEKLELTLGQPIKSYYGAMFSFVLREQSGGAETIDKLTELHNALSSLDANPRVKYTSDIVPALLYSFFAASQEMDDPIAYKSIFPVILERSFQLFPRNKYQPEIRDILSKQIKEIVTKTPDIVSLNHEEILTFFSQISATTYQNVALISTVAWCVGECTTNENCNSQQIIVLYEAIELLIYEVSQCIGDPSNVVARPEVVSSLISALSKLAAYSQELIPRAVVCLNKLSIVRHQSSKHRLSRAELLAVTTYAQELIHVLQKPKVAPAILCDKQKVIPWHLDANASSLIKVHVLSRHVGD